MIKFKELKKYIRHFKIFLATNWKDPKKDMGLVVVFKKDMSKKDKQLKRICVIIVGDTVEELQHNFSKISCLYEFEVRAFMNQFDFEDGGVIN